MHAVGAAPTDGTNAHGLGADDVGVHLIERDDLAVDVLVDGERVWSFNPRRDARQGDDGGWFVPWPPPLRKYLNGVGQVTAREHVSKRVIFDERASFGTSTKPLNIRDKAGRPLSISKTGHLGRSFAERDPEAIESLMATTEAALDFLTNECGIDAFLAFGGLLGAVRDGKLIGHDVDLDLGYVSRWTTPVDVARESFELERKFIKAGWRTWRFSADDFKVLVKGVSSAAKWIDIFGGFVADGVFYLMPNVAAPADQVQILPLGTIELEGHRIAAPANPEQLMEATYGPGWRVPDPSFKYQTPRLTVRRMDGWMRNAIANRAHWLPFYSGAAGKRVPDEPTDFAVWVDSQQPRNSKLVDIGCGSGRDTTWLAERGHDVRGYDYAPPAVFRARALAKKHGVQPRVGVRFRQFNLYDVRQVLTLGGLLSHEAEPVSVYARFLPHAVNDMGRRNLWLLARMSLRRGGKLYLEFRVDADPHAHYEFGPHFRARLQPDAIVREIVEAGGHVVHREEGRGLAVFKDEDPRVCRIVATWKR